jgi:hypothetical protein
MARSGTISRRRTIDAPTRFPAERSGVLVTAELNATEISPMEVRNPSIKNATEKPLRPNFRATRLTDSTKTPEKNQITAAENVNVAMWVRNSIPTVYRVPGDPTKLNLVEALAQWEKRAGSMSNGKG